MRSDGEMTGQRKLVEVEVEKKIGGPRTREISRGTEVGQRGGRRGKQ